MDNIGRATDASFTIIAYNRDAAPIDTVRAFFISADGLAITMASILQRADSVRIFSSSNRNLALERVVAVHPYSNLAMIRVSGKRRDAPYMVPTRDAFNVLGEVLVLTNENSRDGGFSYGKVKDATYSFFLGRGALLDVRAGISSRGAPVLDNKGNLVGVYCPFGVKNEGGMLAGFIINDGYWENVNLPWWQFKRNAARTRFTSPFLLEALMLQGNSAWVESARNFTFAMRDRGNSAELYALRSLSRYSYGNSVGGEEDFNLSIRLQSDFTLPHYARAVWFKNNQQPKEAINDLLICTFEKPNAAQVFYLLGELYAQNKDVKRAYASLSYCVKLDSLMDKAYYERGKLLLHHSSDAEMALSDFTIAARLDPLLPGVFTLIGNITLNNGDYLAAVNFFTRALQINPKDAHALMSRGLAYYNTGQSRRACADWESAGKLGESQAFRLLSRHCSEIRR